MLRILFIKSYDIILHSLNNNWRFHICSNMRILSLTSLRYIDNLQKNKIFRSRFELEFFALDGAGAPIRLRYVEKPIIIHRGDVLKLHNYLWRNGPLRDFLIVRLPMKIGLRPLEVATLQIEHINFRQRTFYVRDSKKWIVYPLPLDPITLDLIREYVEEAAIEKGYLFPGRKGNAPLQTQSLSSMVKRRAEQAGCINWRGMTMYLLRHYFAAEWHYIRHGSIEVLRRILRHKSLATTQRYLERLFFYEDIQAEYDRIQGGPLTHKPVLSPLYLKQCQFCIHEPTCRFLEQACSNPWADSCRFFEPKPEKEKAKNGSRS